MAKNIAKNGIIRYNNDLFFIFILCKELAKPCI